ncbi:hypothetical protein [Polyangium sorediatum]|uniref:Tetratricopeptide repeat protein n=1 Tax=Polyangium sorediatum TaxID=889274 RepID=A0ABT6NNW9_9BACT|nr:hypothetical protein [Polyangium sorediatum]MDI1429976.1 hypothetical protein [Polyangium sorediatum]
MSRPFALAVLLLLSLSAPIKAAEPEKPAQSKPDEPKPTRASRYRKLSPEDEERFKARVAAGDRALEARRLNEAADRYTEALTIKHDPRLSGRLGLVLSMFLPDPQTDLTMAFALQVAVSEAAGISSAERRQFFEAYERVRKRVCRIDVMVNDVDAMVSIGVDRRVRSEGAFWTFISPGKTDISATLTGRKDLKQTAECVDGKSILLQFEFPEPDASQPQIITIEKEPTERRVIVREVVRAPNAAREPLPLEAEAPPRFNVGIGPVMVFGAAPSASLGFSLVGQYRRQSFSVMAVAKGAWSLGDVVNRPIDIFSASAVAGPCAHWQWFQGCALAGATLFDHRLGPTSVYGLYTDTHVVPTLGLGVGATYGITSTVSARIFADAAALTRDVVVDIAAPGGTTPIWQTNRFLFSVSASLMFGR